MLVALTLAFGTTPPDGSVTVPRMAPKVDCARAVGDGKRKLSNTETRRVPLDAAMHFAIARNNNIAPPMKLKYLRRSSVVLR
jgi:hypothetical protein